MKKIRFKFPHHEFVALYNFLGHSVQTYNHPAASVTEKANALLYLSHLIQVYEFLDKKAFKGLMKKQKQYSFSLSVADALGLYGYFHSRHIAEVYEEILIRGICNSIHKTYLV